MSDSSVKYPNHLRFDVTEDDIKAWPEKLIQASKARLDKVAASIASPSWEGTIQVFLDDDAQFGQGSSNCTFFSYVHEKESMRDAATEAEKVLDKYRIEASQRYDVYLAIKAYVDNQAPKDNLNVEQTYALQQLMRDFKLEGLTVDEETRAKVKAIKEQLSEMSITFGRNIAEDKTQVEFTREELDGVSEQVLKQLKKTEDGSKYIVTMKYPEMLPVLEKCHNPKTRRTLAEASQRRLLKENVPLLEKTVELRQQLANLLGFETPAHHLLANKMALKPNAVLTFLEDLCAKLEPGLDKELAAAVAAKDEEAKKRGYEADGKMNYWDRLYGSELILNRDYAIDNEAISEFFPMEHVVQATLDIYQEIFGVKFSKTENAHVWHPDVVQFSVHDLKTSGFVGHFYLDLHPRDGKYTHAAEICLIKACTLNGKRVHPAAAMVANFTKPTADSPSLLRHNEVTTWAHELGHVLHELLATSTYAPWAGTNTARDFVEAPSQALENWCYEREALRRLSKHYKTGEPLSDDQVAALVRSRNANAAIHYRRQLFYGLFDMQLHSLSPKDPKPDTGKLFSDLMTKITKVSAVEDSNGAATFGHIMGGYQACYYGYLWSEAFSADIFQQFKKNGIFNSQLGRTYREKVLARGGSRPEMDSLVDFLGREPNNEAFMQRIGLAPSS